jgi:hypothetical protein
MKIEKLWWCNENKTHLCDECRGQKCKEKKKKNEELLFDTLFIQTTEESIDTNYGNNDNQINRHLSKAWENLRKARKSLNQ